MSHISLKGFLNNPELQKEKAKDYRNVVATLLVLVVLGLLLYEPLIEDSTSDLYLKPAKLVNIESVWGVLYAMLIIGKLLGSPRLENENKN